MSLKPLDIPHLSKEFLEDAKKNFENAPDYLIINEHEGLSTDGRNLPTDMDRAYAQHLIATGIKRVKKDEL